MKKSDAAGFIDANCQHSDFGVCDLKKALYEFDRVNWSDALKLFDYLDGRKLHACWPSLTFRIGGYHISYMLDSDLNNFQVEVITSSEKKFLGIFNNPKFFEFRNVNKPLAREYLEKFYNLSHAKQREYYSQQLSKRAGT